MITSIIIHDVGRQGFARELGNMLLLVFTASHRFVAGLCPEARFSLVPAPSMQPCVLGLSLFIDRDVGIGILPQHQKFLI
jgi:hypothetical protein